MANIKMEAETIQLPYGCIKGYPKLVKNKTILEFLNIPYTKPRTGPNRFKRPEPIDPSENLTAVINHRTFQTCPPQVSMTVFPEEPAEEDIWAPKERQDEDCLYINVWCPQRQLDTNQKRGVLFWIYGGGFVSGSSSLEVYNGAVLCGRQDVIVVSFNYRLGMLGFLDLDGFEGVGGNQGIWDQIEALKWTYNFIELFGGDKSNIMIAGNSAGACSVTLHLLIDQCWPMINGAIINSGCCLSDWGFCSRQESLNRSREAINQILHQSGYTEQWQFDLDTNAKHQIFNILQNIDFTKLVDQSRDLHGFLQFYWTSCIDNCLIKEDPRSLLAKNHYKQCPIIILNVKNESDFFLLYEYPELKSNSLNRTDKINDDYLYKCLPTYPHFTTKSDDALLNDIRSEYNLDKRTFNLNLLDEIMSHRFFVSDSIELADEMSRNCDIYYWWFEVKLPQIKEGLWPQWVGVMHGDEIYDLFGICLQDGYDWKLSETVKEYQKVEAESAELYIEKIGEFIHNRGKLKNQPLYSNRNRQITLIQKEGWSSSRFNDALIKYCDFWKKIRQKFHCSARADL